MKPWIIFMSLVSIASISLSAQEKPAYPPEWEPHIKAAEVGPEHQRLAPYAGDWILDQTAWFEPGKPPEKVQGTCRIDTILGGRYLRMAIDSSTMGLSYSGIAMIGYDNLAEVYTMDWRSTMDTWVSEVTGTFDEANGTIAFSGKMKDAVMGEQDYRFTLELRDADHLHQVMYMNMGGQEIKMMEMAFTRAK